jgi:prepilin-type processing-associated H-X9-DG protein
MEAQAAYSMIDFSKAQVLQMTTGGGVTPFNINYRAYAVAEGIFLCPSDPNVGRIISENNYRYNFGGSTPYGGAQSTSAQTNRNSISPDGFPAGGNGAFTIGNQGLKGSAITDGLSKTAFFSERTKGSGRNNASELPTKDDVVTMQSRPNSLVPRDTIYNECLGYTPKVDSFNFMSTGRWLEGEDFSNGWPFAGYSNTEYNHVATPNWQGQDCGNYSAIPDTPGEHAIMSARSKHPGIVNVCFGDGHVTTVADSINLAVWRALGSRNLGETTGDFE